MSRNWDKFCLLLWKNWLLQWRHKLQTVVEVMAPVLFSCLLVLIRSLVDPEYKEATKYEPFNAYPIVLPQLVRWKSRGRTNRAFCNATDWTVAWSPQNDLIENLMNAAFCNTGDDCKFADKQSINLLSFNDSRTLSSYLTNPLENHMACTLAGVDFGDSSINQTELPKSISFSIRFPAESRAAAGQGPRSTLNNWRTNLLFPLFQLPGPRDPEQYDGGTAPGYVPEGFLGIQNAISQVITDYHVKLINPTQTIPEVAINRYPYPKYIDDPLLLALQAFISIVIMLSFVYTCINTVKVVTTEKELQLKEAMKIMGLPNWLHWTAWFIKTFTFTTISVILIVILLKVKWYPESDLAVFTHADGTVLFVFLLLYMFASICFCFMLSVFFSRANTAAAIAGLAWFLSYAPYLFMQQEYGSLSFTQKIAASIFSNTAMAYGMQLMLMHEGTGSGIQWSNIWAPVTPDDDLYMGHLMLMLVLGGLVYLLITLYVEAIFPGRYGVPQPWNFPFTASYWCGASYQGVKDISSARSTHDDIIEQDPEGLHAGIQVKRLRKVYDNNKVAVEGLDLNMFEDQITVLLGHNGAGKTTTMSMITGMFPPTDGTAVVNGHDIRTDIEGVRDSLGLCPQHNVLFGELTVREHLYFFAKLKGLEGDEIKQEVDHYIDLLELRPKADSPSSTLSGGMQRKLSVGVALCGGSKVVLCDEPTSGMDPAARRALWDLLQSEKKGRTILLSTHFMDEADLLGDRIAIMAEGKLKCAGSSFFLKKQFGAGYHLVIVKDIGCDVGKVTELLRKYIPEIYVETDIGTELSYSLDERQSAVFENMLRDLETKSRNLKLLSYGISLTTLEEVFMKVGADHSGVAPISEAPMNGNGVHANGDHEVHLNGSQFKASQIPLLTGLQLSFNQFGAMFRKKFIIWHRNWMLFVIQNIIQIACLIITIIVARATVGENDLPQLKINFAQYGKSLTVIQNNSVTSSHIGKMIEQYQHLIPKGLHHVYKITSEPDMNDYILKTIKEKIPTYNMQYLVGASFADSKITAWFNNQPYHALPLTLNLVHNAIIKGLVGPEYSIDVVNAPLNFTQSTKIDKLSAGNNMGFQLAFNTGFSLAFVSAFYILFCVRERVCKAKHLQFVSGVEVLTFWCSSFLWDMISFTITSLVWVITIAPFQQDGFATGPELGRAFFVLLSFGWAMLPMVYIASFLFDIPSTGFVRITLISIFSGVATFMVIEILNQPGLKLDHIGRALHWGFLLIPHYGVSSAFKNLNDISSYRRICKAMLEERPGITEEMLCTILPICCYDDNTYFQWAAPGIGRNLLYFFLVGLVLFLFLIIIEYRVGQKLLYKIRKLRDRIPPVESEDGILDSDVQAEKFLVHSLEHSDIKEHSLVLNDFTKYYGNFLAVNQLCVGVRHAECFGLLGINGAGKTSTFKMLTGDEMISSGNAFVNGMSLKTDMKKVHQVIGYCPQFDALIEELSGRETLVMFCLLRGVPSGSAKTLANKLAHELNFNQHIDKKVREYSGGNKRKLSTAIALIGEPSVVYLDEPTTGMDPAAKRHLWNAVCRIRDTGTCIVLTSHSMEECEALCTRLAVMVNGEFKCLGSTQHLKNKFSKGYTLIVKLKKDKRRILTSAGGNALATPGTTFGETVCTPGAGSGTRTGLLAGDHYSGHDTMLHSIEAVNDFIVQNFPTAILKESHQCLLTYYIPSTDIPWSRMFGVMESGKVQLGIEDYSLGQTTLEQVFLSFTKKQRSEDNPLP